MKTSDGAALDVPGDDRFGPTVARFDQWADDQLERIRGNPVADAVFTTASHVGDFSLIWHVVSTLRGVSSEEKRRQAAILSVALGIESLVVNQGIKRLFERTRPTETGDERFTVRRPHSSSFPSGHASSAFFAASILTMWSGRRSAPLWFGLAAVVGSSRAYVRIHHASDVLAGATLGLAMGAVARRIMPE